MAKRATAKTTRGRKPAASKRKAASNTYARWSRDEIKKLRQLARDNMSTNKIGSALGRTAIAIQGKAQREGISLRTAEPMASRAKRAAKRTAKRR